MRKLLALLVLVPFAVVVVLSCDDHPTAPETAQAAGTVQASSTPQAAKTPPWGAPTALSGAVIVDQTATSYGNGMFWPKVWCPEGKVPVAGGFNIIQIGDLLYDGWRVLSNAPITTSQGNGWVVGIQKLCYPCDGTEDDLTVMIHATCVDAEFAG